MILKKKVTEEKSDAKVDVSEQMEEELKICEHGGECQCKHTEKHNGKGHHSLEDVKKELELLKHANDELQEKLNYAHADMINYRKRKDDETSNLLRYANQELIMELLPILDNFERAMKASEKNQEMATFVSGFQMIYNHLNETLKKFGVTEIEAMDLPFDPSCHEAMMTGCVKEKADDVVLEVMIKGYRLFERVIRPSVVKVNKLED